MELGEGVCKLRKMEFPSGPFRTFEREITAVLDFVYLTQIELAACEFFFFSITTPIFALKLFSALLEQRLLS